MSVTIALRFLLFASFSRREGAYMLGYPQLLNGFWVDGLVASTPAT